MNQWKDLPTESPPTSSWHIQAQAEQERRKRRIERLSRTISDRDINFARYAQWAMIRIAHGKELEGIEIPVRPEGDFFRSEIERFEAWTLKEIRTSELQNMNDEELIRHYHELKNKLIACFKHESSEPKAERND